MSVKQEPPKLSYAVVIYRKDNEHIIVLRDNDFTKCKTLWQNLQDKWIACVKEVLPFVLKDPEVTCFEPGLIKEIKVEPIMGSSVTEGMEDNPYMKNMMRNGFSASRGQGVTQTGIDLLDSGFKR